MCGVGKTDLALQFIHTQMSSYDAIFFIDASGYSQLSTDFNNIAVELGLVDQDQVSDVDTRRQHIKAWLEGRHPYASEVQVSWLLVFDNADKLELLFDYLPSRGNGAILVTSRDPDAKNIMYFAEAGIDLDPFSDEDGTNLLRKLTECDQTDTELLASRKMAQSLGCLPLALVQMAGAIKKREISVQESLAIVEKQDKYAKFRTMDNAIQRRRYKYSLATAFNFDALTHTTSELLKVLAVLHPDRIPERLFTTGDDVNNWQTVDDLAAGDTHDAFETSRVELRECSMIKRDKRDRVVSIHRVTAQEVRAQMSREELNRVLRKAVDLLSAKFLYSELKKKTTAERWAICQVYFPHVDSVSMLLEEQFDRCGYPDDAFPIAKLLWEAGAYSRERGMAYVSRRYLKQSLALCETCPSTREQRDLLAWIHYELGAVAFSVHDSKASMQHNLNLMQLCKSAAEETGIPSAMLAAAHNQLGVAYTLVDDFETALSLFRQSIAVYRSLEDFSIDMLAFPVANLGLTFWVLDKYDDAEQTFASALEEREAKFGVMDRLSYKTGRILYGYGNVLESKALLLQRGNTSTEGEVKTLMDRSYELHLRGMRQIEENQGDNHYRIADICHKLAGHHLRSCEYERARNYVDRALGIWGHQNWYRNLVCRTTFLKGRILLAQGLESEGRRCIEAAKFKRREILGLVVDDVDAQEEDFDKLVVFWCR
ncbi:hypothetical protein BDZ85DRAFT_50329 [Elsinoe ampelina]|uniref:DUF7779 domain-containing protein n=1 Tax=Elsinoe ampelina TaxID=302913 RepID=A0A6A6GL27_9PEZI|nr:hypothetical protein BDZ85DRAFT_50329 [Elsinoe ampelina]